MMARISQPKTPTRLLCIY